MLTLAELTSRFPRAGCLEKILLRPARKSDLVPLEMVAVSPDGLTGDHARPGKRAVTLIQQEHIPVIAALSGHDALDPVIFRRNLVVSGLNLNACRGKRLQIGADVVLEVTGPCAPCSRMETALGEGGYNAMRGHGGWCARVIATGQMSIRDAVVVLPAQTQQDDETT